MARLLVTNDDGIHGPGLHALAGALADAGHEVVVVAPDYDASGTGASIGRFDPSSHLPGATGRAARPLGHRGVGPRRPARHVRAGRRARRLRWGVRRRGVGHQRRGEHRSGHPPLGHRRRRPHRPELRSPGAGREPGRARLEGHGHRPRGTGPVGLGPGRRAGRPGHRPPPAGAAPRDAQPQHPGRGRRRHAAAAMGAARHLRHGPLRRHRASTRARLQFQLQAVDEELRSDTDTSMLRKGIATLTALGGIAEVWASPPDGPADPADAESGAVGGPPGGPGRGGRTPRRATICRRPTCSPIPTSPRTCTPARSTERSAAPGQSGGRSPHRTIHMASRA